MKNDRLSDDYLFDVRLVERHISQGRITRQEVDRRNAATPDLAEQAEAVDLGRLTGGAAARRPKA